ncbi:MAG TPA: Holliday junction resolvase RuvX [Candidatus Saccharimonadales bacterium]|nr:Holliday junction resolvase RuvX [Candidatus Saccharimonadales bacterium]
MLKTSSDILALDVGGTRIGVAHANPVARIASPLTTVINDATVFEKLVQLLQQQDAAVLVVGLPRNLSGDSTEQTRIVEQFVLQLKQHIDLPVYWQDEAVTSRQAEAELRARGKPYAKGDIDALAATYILEDFLRDHPEVKA